MIHAIEQNRLDESVIEELKVSLRNANPEGYTISLIEDNPDFTVRLKSLFKRAADFILLDHYASAEDALRNLPRRPPNLLLVDMDLPGMHGSECVRLLRTESKFDSMRIVALTIFENEELILRCLGYGANGYLLKDISPDLLLAELRVAALGGAAMTQSIAARILNARLKPEPSTAFQNPLTERETQVINLISLGITYAEVAQELKLSLHTIRSHIENIYAKLKVTSKSAALKRGRELGVVPSQN
ncbi:MAG: response regulator transcription factor [Spirochaetia bacterium]|nr:response regulator transcription factor [Spirochaetia bacterium]